MPSKTEGGIPTISLCGNYFKKSHWGMWSTSSRSESFQITLHCAYLTLLHSYDRYRDYLKGTWKEVVGPGAGQFYSLGPHLIDQALHCFGRPERVTAFIENIRGLGDETVDDDVSITSLIFTIYADVP
jgi:hypothetical protein